MILKAYSLLADNPTPSFDTYTIPAFSWLPKIETVILENPNLPPQGGGEPAIIGLF
jgi:CO/xanthine dehydrogenase Mo-binding subunit